MIKIATLSLRSSRGHHSLKPSLLSIKLCNYLEATYLEKVKYSLFRHNPIVLRVRDLNNLHKSLPMRPLIKIQLKYLLEKIPCLLVSQITQVIWIKLIIIHPDIVHPFSYLFLTDLLNSLFVVIKYYGQKDIF